MNRNQLENFLFYCQKFAVKSEGKKSGNRKKDAKNPWEKVGKMRERRRKDRGKTGERQGKDEGKARERR